MTAAGGGFEESHSAQAVVATGSLLVVANDVTQAPNAKEQRVPMINKFRVLPTELGRATRVLADSGYFSQANVDRCAAARIEPPITLGRERHHAGWRQRFAPAPKAPPPAATPPERMAHRMKLPAGGKLDALRIRTPEPVRMVPELRISDLQETRIRNP